MIAMMIVHTVTGFYLGGAVASAVLMSIGARLRPDIKPESNLALVAQVAAWPLSLWECWRAARDMRL